jgi:hypothetical protein
MPSRSSDPSTSSTVPGGFFHLSAIRRTAAYMAAGSRSIWSSPTLPLPTRLAKALDASLTVELDGDGSAFVFAPRRDGDGPSGGNAPPGRSSDA